MPLKGLTLSCIALKHGRTNFKNIAVLIVFKKKISGKMGFRNRKFQNFGRVSHRKQRNALNLFKGNVRQWVLT